MISVRSRRFYVDACWVCSPLPASVKILCIEEDNQDKIQEGGNINIPIPEKYQHERTHLVYGMVSLIKDGCSSGSGIRMVAISKSKYYHLDERKYGIRSI